MEEIHIRSVSGFSNMVRAYARRIEKRLDLISGWQLTSLMVDSGVGVNTVSAKWVQRVDRYLFAEE